MVFIRDPNDDDDDDDDDDTLRSPPRPVLMPVKLFPDAICSYGRFLLSLIIMFGGKSEWSMLEEVVDEE